MINILPYLQTIIAAANICVIGYGFYKFLGRPHSTLENRVAVLEAKMKENEESHKLGNDRFRKIEEKEEILLNCMLLFVDFEVTWALKSGYDKTDDLQKAKMILHDYLSKK